MKSPFITLYSLDKKIIGSTEQLHGQVLVVPSGVLDVAKGEIRVTWQPTGQLRFASVTDYVPDFGYVTVAESLQEVEQQAAGVAILNLGSFAFQGHCSGSK